MQCLVNWVISSFLERHSTITSNLNWHTSLWNGLQCEIYSRQQNKWLPKIYQMIVDGMTLPALSRWSNHSSASSTFTMRCSGAYMFEKLHACVPKHFISLKDIVTWWTQEKSYCSVCAMASSEGSCNYYIQTWCPHQGWNNWLYDPRFSYKPYAWQQALIVLTQSLLPIANPDIKWYRTVFLTSAMFLTTRTKLWESALAAMVPLGRSRHCCTISLSIAPVSTSSPTATNTTWLSGPCSAYMTCPHQYPASKEAKKTC